MLLSCSLFASPKQDKPLYKDASRPVEERVEDLLGRMTREEKILQLNQYTLGLNTNENNIGEITAKIPADVGSLIYFPEDPKLRNEMQKHAMEETRLGIPILFGFDVIHGFRTVYPISLAQACSWNTDLVQQACGIAAVESRRSGVDWTFSPMIDVARDGRWGRISEGYGEDPYTNAAFCVASVKGYQGTNLNNNSQVAACLKHYVGYGASEAGRDYVYTEISRQTLWDTYLPPYEAGIKAGATTVMSSFNDISGTPATCNPYTLDEVLKKRWGFDGFVVSDWDAVRQLNTQGAAANREEAARISINAGLDMDMVSHCYEQYLDTLIHKGDVTEERLDDAVTRILALKASLKLHEKQRDGSLYPDMAAAEKIVGCSEHKKISAEIADRSITLVKEEKGVLPITPQRYKRVLVYKKEGKASAVAAGITEGAADKLIAKLKDEGFDVTEFVPGGGWEGMATPVQDVYDRYDLIVYIANLATKSNQTVVRLEWAEPMGADVPVYMNSVPTVFISLENPYHLLDVPRVKTFINTYGSTEEILDALVKKLTGKSAFCGKSPVDAFCGKWDTRL